MPRVYDSTSGRSSATQTRICQWSYAIAITNVATNPVPTSPSSNSLSLACLQPRTYRVIVLGAIISSVSHLRSLAALTLAFTAFQVPLSAQPPEGALTLISTDGRRTIETIDVRGHALLALEELTELFQLDVREDSRADTLTVSYGDQDVILTSNQQLVSVAGRLVSLRAPPRLVEQRWLVPLDFISRALAPIYGQNLELRERSRLLLVGEVRVPRISVRYRSRGRTGQLNLEITPNTAHSVSEEAGRLIIQFEAEAVDVTRQARPRGEIVRDIRVVDSLPGLAVGLGTAFGSYSVSNPPGPDDSTQLVIDLQAAVAETTSAAPARTSVPEVSLPTPTDPLPDFNSVPSIRTIVVDAGHGGTDEGAHGPSGTLEKDITLSVARRLRDAIENQIGVRVILTRSRDAVVELDERASIANNNKADLFISLHANSSVSQSPSGAEVFYLSIDEYGEEARALAEREGHYLPVVGGGTREIDLILWEMAQARYLEQSAYLAEIVEGELRRRVSMSPRAIQQAPFRVLVGANMPAVLVEMGFISNLDQEQQLASATFQDAVVEALMASVLRFRDYLEASRRPFAEGAESSGGDHPAISPHRQDTIGH